MTDKELLDLAANAFRARVIKDPHGQLRDCSGSHHPAMNIFAFPIWNPLTDDGDALRLAVKLEMVVDTMERVIVGSSPSVCVEIDFDEQSACPESAVRRAIVRAAAEIGKEMK